MLVKHSQTVVRTNKFYMRLLLSTWVLHVKIVAPQQITFHFLIKSSTLYEYYSSFVPSLADMVLNKVFSYH